MRSLEELESVFIVPIEQIEIDTKSRDDIPALLIGLQHLYSHKELLQQVFIVMRDHVAPDTNHNIGRPGMNWWQILVLAVVKQGLDCDYARLMELANQHRTLRQMLQHEGHDRHRYTERTLQNNINLIPETVLNQISLLVVQTDLAVARKRPWRRLRRPR